METKNNQTINVPLLIVGVLLIILGFATSGLWPWQLPACFVGGYIVGSELSKNLFNKEKDENEIS